MKLFDGNGHQVECTPSAHPKLPELMVAEVDLKFCRKWGEIGSGVEAIEAYPRLLHRLEDLAHRRNEDRHQIEIRLVVRKSVPVAEPADRRKRELPVDQIEPAGDLRHARSGVEIG